jgi:hypothetical protein
MFGIQILLKRAVSTTPVKSILAFVEKRKQKNPLDFFQWHLIKHAMNL